MDVGDLPVVDHLAELLDRAVEEGLLVLAQSRLGLAYRKLVRFRSIGVRLSIRAT
jgi:hypothetical protein